MFFNCIKLSGKCLRQINQLNGNNVNQMVRIQKYSDWYHRQPVRVVNEEEILQYAEEANGPHEFINEPVKKIIKSENRTPLKVRVKPKKKELKKKLCVAENDLKLRQDGSLNITELDENDNILTTLMMSVRSKKKRDKNSRIILEGSRLICDAIDSGAIPEIIVFSRTSDLAKINLPEKGIKLFKVPYRAIQTWSTLVTPPGLMGFFRIPDVENTKLTHDALPLTIICDNVRDPGNLGSILRAAAAVGCKKLITLVGCVDIWEPKVLKTAAGCHFRLPIFASKTWNDIPKLIDPFASVFVADHNTTVKIVSPDVKNELSEITNENGENDEINLTNEFNENIIKSELDGVEEEELDEFLYTEETDEMNKEKQKTNYQRTIESKEAKKITENIPLIPYYATDYTENENIIIIGGETLGLSLEALNMVNEKFGIRVNIPMTNGVDSLNTGMALGIIAFEIRRQHAVAKKNPN